MMAQRFPGFGQQAGCLRTADTTWYIGLRAWSKVHVPRIMATFVMTAVCFTLSGAFVVSAASASYEWLGGVNGTFGPKGTEGQLGVESAMAVNESSGDVYVADGTGHRVTRFSSSGKFLEAWGWAVANETPLTIAFQRCGQDGEPGHPTCALEGDAPLHVGQVAGAFETPDGIAVDQSTGNVYVLDPYRQQGVVQVFSADGEFIAGFVESASLSSVASGIAVDPSGNVYLSVLGSKHVKIFKPEAPGNYAHYVYTGESHDIVVNESVSGVGVDSASDVYVIAGFAHVDRFAPEDFATLTWKTSPECESKRYGQIFGITVNPTNGDAFTYS